MKEERVEEAARWALAARGTTAQLDQSVEECGELIVAINHYKRGRITANELAEEVADVEIMMAQLRAIVGTGLVDKVKALKVTRLLRRLQRKASEGL